MCSSALFRLCECMAALKLTSQNCMTVPCEGVWGGGGGVLFVVEVLVLSEYYIDVLVLCLSL